MKVEGEGQTRRNMLALSVGYAAYCLLVAQLCLLHPLLRSRRPSLPSTRYQGPILVSDPQPPVVRETDSFPVLTNGTLHPYPYFASFLTFTLCVVLLIVLFCFAPQLTTPNQ